VLRLYAAVGTTPLTVGLSLTSSALPVVLTNADAGLDIATLTPAAPALVAVPTTTRTMVLDTMAHDAAGEPDAGAAPIRALHV